MSNAKTKIKDPPDETVDLSDTVIGKDQSDYEEKLIKAQKSQDKKKVLLSEVASGGAIVKKYPCVVCKEDTTNYFFINCDKCHKLSHFECVDYKRFTENGNYLCVNCKIPKKNTAKEKIYIELKSELAYFIGNVESDQTKNIPYVDIAHINCGVNNWPDIDDMRNLAFHIDDEEGKSLNCLKCNDTIDSESALICKGCLTLTHPKCCYDKEKEIDCDVCHAKKVKLQESMHTDTRKRMSRSREKNHVPRSTTKERSVSDDDSSDDESDNEKSPMRRGSNVAPLAASSPHVSDSKRIRDQLNQLQLNQLLHKNLPPLYEFSQWESFYKAYEETKGNFSDSQNVERLKNAIKCVTVKNWGKNRMFELGTYDERIQYINKTYNLPSVILRMELNKLTQRKRIANHERSRLAQFINDVDDFCVIQKNKGTEASRRDENMIRAIIDVLPKEMGESYISYVHNKPNRDLSIDTLNKFLQKKMFALIFNNPDIIMNNDESNKKLNENDNAEKSKGKFGKFNSHYDNSNNGCLLCDDRRHNLSRCYKALKLSGVELTKKLKEKKICIVCGQEPYSGKGHRCSKPSNKFCNHPQHKDHKHYEILCSLREPSNPQNNHQQDPVVENQNTNRNGNGNFRGRGRGNRRLGQNSSRQNNNANAPQNFLNQNSFNGNPQTLSNSQVNTQASNNVNTVDAEFCTFSAFFNLNKIEQAQWKTSETLLPVIVIKLGKERKPVSFLIDGGSGISLIESYVADYLKEKGQELPIRLNWSGDANYYNRSDPKSRVICVDAEALNGTKRIMHFHTFENLAIAPQTLDVEEIQSKFQHLKNLALQGYKRIHGVIGQDQVNLFRVSKQYCALDGNEDSYLGYETPMGNYVSGTRFSIATLYKRLVVRNKQNAALDHFNAINLTHSGNLIDSNELKLLEERLMGEEYFEEPPINDKANADELYAMTVLEQEMKKDNNGKFVSPLIFKEENPKLPAFESYCSAKKRHFALITMLKRHDKFDEVNEEIQKMLSKGYCEKVPYNELRSYDMTYYLPIFCISPPNKRTRVIWDGRAECSTGESLNSFLLPGPNLYNNLLQIYLNMRSENILIVGDLEEMFHQIVIKPEHRNALRFLWANEINKEPEMYRMTRLVFGLNCAPFIAQFAVKLTSKNIEKSHPQIAEILNKDIYMDDIVTSSSDIEKGQNVIVALKRCLSEAGFNLVKLKSSHPKTLDKLKEILSNEELAHEKLFPEGNMHRVLGYLNDFHDDTIGLGINYEKFERFLKDDVYPSKREVLRLSRSIYDPLGLFSFLTSKFKFVYHLICENNLNWEDLITDDIYKLWKQSIAWLTPCCRIRLPRCYMKNVNDSQIKQLWAFSDASEDSECVAIYYRLINNDRSQANVTLVMAKDFVVPKKANRSIPELELDAATKAVLLLENVIKLHTKIKFDEIFLAVDNSPTFFWLLYGHEKPSVYIKNRLKRIKNVNIQINFKWVPTDYQVADFGTKFSSMPVLDAENDWFMPKLFRLAEEDWPSDQFLRKNNNKNLITQKHNSYAWERFSTLCRLVESFRELFAFLSINIRTKKLRKLNDKNNHEYQVAKSISRKQWRANKLKYDDMSETIELLRSDINFKREEAIKHILIKVQSECFEEEIKTVANGSQLPLNHQLGKLYLCVNDGLLCNTSRLPEKILKEKRFKEFKRHTIMLPKNHHVTKLIILQAHADNNHFHVDTTIAMLRKTYYIANIRSTVIKTIRENCYLCRKINRRPHAPLCGDLPIEKLCVDHSPFTNVMIDMAGPYMIKTRKTRSEATLKRYLLVVICLTTRAMHIEIMCDASADSFIKALLITFELRGYPRKIICDRGTNFIGADNALRKLLNDHNQLRAQKGLSPLKFMFEFRFNPARSPHMQGSVERLIGNVKAAMNKMKKFVSEWSGELEESTFRFIIISIVGMMNNRPLCTVNIKGSNSFLTPNSFIMNRENNSLCPPIDPPEKYDQLWSRYLEIQKVLWEHYVDHCVPQWITREKWLKPTKNFTIGEIVLTVDYRKVNEWRLARVIDVELGSNDQVRKLTLMLGKQHQAITKQNRGDFKSYAKALYAKGKCYKVTRAAAHVIKLDLYCEENLRIPKPEELEELNEDL